MQYSFYGSFLQTIIDIRNRMQLNTLHHVRREENIIVVWIITKLRKNSVFSQRRDTMQHDGARKWRGYFSK